VTGAFSGHGKRKTGDVVFLLNRAIVKSLNREGLISKAERSEAPEGRGVGGRCDNAGLMNTTKDEGFGGIFGKNRAKTRIFHATRADSFGSEIRYLGKRDTGNMI